MLSLQVSLLWLQCFLTILQCTFLIQLKRVLSVIYCSVYQVVTTCRPDAVSLLESFGTDCVIDYTHSDAEKQIREEGK
jgi:NADPH:quinone reductase-like Zn-dependent oxidoreductase